MVRFYVLYKVKARIRRLGRGFASKSRWRIGASAYRLKLLFVRGEWSRRGTVIDRR